MIEGQDPGKPLVLQGGGTVSISSGRTLNSDDATANVAIVGTQYSTDKSVVVGDTITLNGTAIKVVGVYSSGNRFGDNGIVLPYETAKRVYAVTGMNTVYVTVDYAGNVDTVVAQLKSSLGADYDVVSASSMATAIQNSINGIAANSQTGLILAMITGVAVMIFVMILITRERTKEIGVLKAIGFKNSSIVAQFFAESVVLAVIGFIVGLIIVMSFGPTLANMMLGTSSGSGGGFGPGGGGFRGEMGGSVVERIDFSLQPVLTAYTLLLAIVLGIIGSVYPIMRAISLKPAEALRYD
jgi:putative ABC transport system permease protein